MPIYEYFCQDCRRRVSIFYRTLSAATAAEPRCPRCQSAHLTRLISRVAVVRSEEARMDALADPSLLAGLDEEDPRTLGRMMRQMSSELGEDMEDAEFNEVIERLESGQSPEEIEQSLPDLAGESGGFDDFSD